MFPCSLFDGKKTEQLKPFIFYEISNVKDENVFCCGHNCEVPFVFNLYEVLNLDKFNLNVQKVAIKLDTFIFLKAYRQVECDYFNFKSGNKKIDIVISNKILIRVENEVVIEKSLGKNISFSHIEEFAGFQIVYFNGERPFVVIAQNGEVKFVDYYDEINIEKEEKLFMVRQNDLLNHGRVASLKDGKFETYLVYLDNFELKMKNQFVFLVFLDCFLCGNLKYCNQLLCDEIKQKDEKKIKNFFDGFDFYIPFRNLAFVFKKNTLAGVYDFIVCNNKIENINRLMPFD